MERGSAEDTGTVSGCEKSCESNQSKQVFCQETLSLYCCVSPKGESKVFQGRYSERDDRGLLSHKMSKRPWFFLIGDPFRNSHRVWGLECNDPQGQWMGSFPNLGCWQPACFIFYFLEFKVLLRTHWPCIMYYIVEKEVCNMSLSTDRRYKKGPYLHYFHFVEKDKITICLTFWSVGCLCISRLAELKSWIFILLYSTCMSGSAITKMCAQ